MARETAYRLRNKPGAEGFRAAWDVALLGAFERLGTDVRRERWLSAYEAALVALRPHKVVTLAQLRWRVETGVWHAVLRGGRYCGVRRKPDDSALLALLSRTRGCEAGGAS